MSYYPSYFMDVLTAHGVLGSIAWVVLFPLGGIVLAYAMFCVTFGTGVWFSYLNGAMTDPHPIMGSILFGLTTLQPFLGTMHHRRFVKVERRTFLSILHIQLGRMLITVGMINGGLGLLLGVKAKTLASAGQAMAYGIIAGIMWLAYIITVSATENNDVKKWYSDYEKRNSGSFGDGDRDVDEEKSAESPSV